MIIKELRIGSFAGIENKVISFKKGMNIIYGKNEAGKSRIESFIKVMLYGLYSRKIKGESERKKYISFNKDTAYGEMLVSHEGIDYLIKRKFGNTKKYDSSEVLDYLTGEKVDYINSDEPGKYFLGINKSTFEKTLFISQLAVAFSKDKEEEIMDKVTVLFGCGDNEVSGEKAIGKLETLKKNYVTSRGTGSLDLLNKKYNNLQEERYDAKKLAESNLVWENDLLTRKQDKERLNKEIESLEVYKKYLKKIKLQEEYKEILQYFKESEALKKEENEIIKKLSKDGNIIDEEFLDNILEESNEYLRYVDEKGEREEELKYFYKGLEEKKAEFENYKFIDLFGDNLKDRLLQIKYEQRNLEEKIKYSKEINALIKKEELELEKRRLRFKKIIDNEKLEKNIIDNLNLYETKLKELKENAYSEEMYSNIDKERNNKKFKVIVGSVFIVLGVIMTFIKSFSLIVSLILILLGLGVIYAGIHSYEVFEKSSNNYIERLSEEIKQIELYISEFRESLELDNNEELIKYINKYISFKQYEEKVSIRIEEKKKILSSNDYTEALRKYDKNNDMISSLIRISNCKNINDVIEAIDMYTKIKSEIEVINEKIFNMENSIKNIESDIKKREYLLKDKLSIIGVQEIEFLDIHIVIKEYKEKVRKLQEVSNNLKSIENTYSALIKDRDINVIKEELKDMINNDDNYSYESEEEIELEEKLKSKELIQCEKDIKDIENKIDSRFIGKRNLVEVEEEISQVLKKINEYKNMVLAIELTVETLGESIKEVRKTVGPVLNKSIAEIFSNLTDGKYNEIKLDTNYEMMVRNENSLFKGSYLSNGAYDQLYLALRIALIDLLFNKEECSVILDDAFVQYDDNRREKALLFLEERINGQILIFTCHSTEEKIMLSNNRKVNYIAI